MNIHKLTKSGRAPFAACQMKHKKCHCKSGFPKEKQMNSGKVLFVCPGIARKFAVRVNGRRNALGSAIGLRNCPWLCGTAPAIAVCFRSNTNTAPNWRVPIVPETHDDEHCTRQCVQDPRILKDGSGRVENRQAVHRLLRRVHRQKTAGGEVRTGAKYSLVVIVTEQHER